MRVGVAAACEDIRGGVAKLGPRVHRDVRFCEQPEGGDALWLEAMGDMVEPGRSGGFGGAAHRADERIGIVEQLRATAVELQDAMGANG